MRPELELIEKIEKYLKGELSDAERAEFEQQISANSELQKEVKLQQDIMNGLARVTIKQSMQKAYHAYVKVKNFLKWGSTGLGIAIVSTALIYFIAKQPAHNKFEQVLPALNEIGTKEWSDADKYLPAQKFTITSAKDTVIQTNGGIVMAIPANCFLDNNGKPVTGPIEFEVKEALDPATIIKSGLSTKSGNKLLESGGMFYINGRKDGVSLNIDPNNGIYARIPTDKVKDSMKLFEGKRMPDGSIDWVNPKPLVHNLVPVNIHKLNFYPPLYLDSLKTWGFNNKNKKFTDSLYYSFAYLFHQDSRLDTTGISVDTINIAEGMQLFKTNCAVCHSLGSNKITGPGMAGISNRVPQPSQPWLLKYIKNNIAVKKSGDRYANELTNINQGTVMTVFDGVLTDKQINEIIACISTIPQTNVPIIAKRDSSFMAPICGINPSKIKTIWSDEFQNTLISTREFENRMTYIHKTGNEAILDLYVNNLDKSLSYIDSLAAMQLTGELRATFLSFAAKNDGKVVPETKNQEKLIQDYTTKSKLFTEEAYKNRIKFSEAQNKLDSIAYSKQFSDISRNRKMMVDEYKINLKEAARQVGDSDSIAKVDKNGYVVLCTGTGWKNLDAYVWESVATRATLNYTSPTNGKTAIIRYLACNIKVKDYKKYDNIFVYLLPSKLNSFMRLDDSLGSFKENLNELMKYNLVCVGYKGNNSFIYSMADIKPQDYNDIELKEINPKTMTEQINRLCNESQQKDMTKERDYAKYKIEDEERQKRVKDIYDLDFRVATMLFPCYERE